MGVDIVLRPVRTVTIEGVVSNPTGVVHQVQVSLAPTGRAIGTLALPIAFGVQTSPTVQADAKGSLPIYRGETRVVHGHRPIREWSR